MTLTNEEIQALQALAERATKGPVEWVEDHWNGGHRGMEGPAGEAVLSPLHRNDGDGGAAWFDEWENQNDRLLIAAAYNAVPALCADLLAARAEVERLIAVNAELRKWLDLLANTAYDKDDLRRARTALEGE